MRIDAHHHFWRPARGDYGWLTAEAVPSLYRDYMPPDMAPLLAACGIERTVLVQAAQTVAETEFLLAIADTTPFVAGVVGWADFEAPDAADEIARLARHRKLVSLRPMLQDLPDDTWILKPELAPAFAALKAAGLCYDVLIFPRHLPHVFRFLAEDGDLSAVIDHGAKPYIARGEIEPWAGWMRRLGRETAAACKLSGLLTETGDRTTQAALKPYVDVLLEAFGPQRLMWGSDWPVLTLAGDYTGWLGMAESLTAGLSADEKAAVFGGTAARFYGLDGR
ncbi:MAG: amidohydrolase family protein [Alphaproteobacteria bacterium]|nr:amidohydrolase family protein [Alphaproteobacteria bacterium]